MWAGPEIPGRCGEWFKRVGCKGNGDTREITHRDENLS
jgi:hypothetical protein